MFVIIGIAIVLISVLGGFFMEGGPAGVLFQWAEFLIIVGASVGALLISTPQKIMKKIIAHLFNTLKGDPYSKDRYIELLKTLYEFFQIAQRDGLISIEQHVEKPHESTIFRKNPFLLSQSHALEFFTDTMKMLLNGSLPAYEVELLMDTDLETHHAESNKSPTILQRIGDSLPGLGIVAAVLGIVITMQAINGPPEEIGHKVAAALVGTFTGILLSYGFVQPLAGIIEQLNDAEARYLQCIKAGVLAFAKGTPPILAIEYARRSIYTYDRPSFEETERTCRGMNTSTPTSV